MDTSFSLLIALVSIFSIMVMEVRRADILALFLIFGKRSSQLTDDALYLNRKCIYIPNLWGFL